MNHLYYWRKLGKKLKLYILKGVSFLKELFLYKSESNNNSRSRIFKREGKQMSSREPYSSSFKGHKIILTQKSQRMDWRVGKAFLTKRGWDKLTLISLDDWTLRGKRGSLLRLSRGLRTNSWGWWVFRLNSGFVAPCGLSHAVACHTMCLVTYNEWICTTIDESHRTFWALPRWHIWVYIETCGMYYKFPKQAFRYLHFVPSGLSHACLMCLLTFLYVILCVEFIGSIIFNDLLYQHKFCFLFYRFCQIFSKLQKDRRGELLISDDYTGVKIIPFSTLKISTAIQLHHTSCNVHGYKNLENLLYLLKRVSMIKTLLRGKGNLHLLRSVDLKANFSLALVKFDSHYTDNKSAHTPIFKLWPQTNVNSLNSMIHHCSTSPNHFSFSSTWMSYIDFYCFAPSCSQLIDIIRFMKGRKKILEKDISPLSFILSFVICAPQTCRSHILTHHFNYKQCFHQPSWDLVRWSYFGRFPLTYYIQDESVLMSHLGSCHTRQCCIQELCNQHGDYFLCHCLLELLTLNIPPITMVFFGIPDPTITLNGLLNCAAPCWRYKLNIIFYMFLYEELCVCALSLFYFRTAFFSFFFTFKLAVLLLEEECSLKRKEHPSRCGSKLLTVNHEGLKQENNCVFLSLNFISFSLSFQLQLPTHSADYLSPPHGPFGCILLPASRYICSSFFRSRNRSSTIISSCMSPSPPLVLMDVLAAHILFFPLLSLSWYY
ncbi:hypothetical protein VP01_1148g1 [Puccinia sorghi]|uniref:Uncharacterized protein n=1 Tax=Puccinia sorghi TaxID=27349 RepID=A0A0L6VT85_9BASI|nr:hypothetical protein VP01_1148g1 [Puccinia sorghi]